MESLWKGVMGIARVGIGCGGAMLFAAALIVTAEVVLRKGLGAVFGTTFTFSGSDEISGYLFAVGTSWSMAYVLCTRGHVRIDAVYGNLSQKVRGWLDLVALLVLGIFVAALTERAFDVASTSFVETIRSNTNLRIPLAWAQIPWFLGILLFLVAIVLAVVRILMALLKGDYARVAEISGIPSQDEEIASEVRSLGIEMPHGEKK